MPAMSTVSYWDENLGRYEGYIVNYDGIGSTADFWIDYGDAVFVYVAYSTWVTFNP